MYEDSKLSEIYLKYYDAQCLDIEITPDFLQEFWKFLDMMHISLELPNDEACLEGYFIYHRHVNSLYLIHQINFLIHLIHVILFPISPQIQLLL